MFFLIIDSFYGVVGLKIYFDRRCCLRVLFRLGSRIIVLIDFFIVFIESLYFGVI